MDTDASFFRDLRSFVRLMQEKPTCMFPSLFFLLLIFVKTTDED